MNLERDFRLELVQGVKLLGGHFASLCQEFDFNEVKRILSFSKNKSEILLHF